MKKKKKDFAVQCRGAGSTRLQIYDPTCLTDEKPKHKTEAILQQIQ